MQQVNCKFLVHYANLPWEHGAGLLPIQKNGIFEPGPGDGLKSVLILADVLEDSPPTVPPSGQYQRCRMQQVGNHQFIPTQTSSAADLLKLY